MYATETARVPNFREESPRTRIPTRSSLPVICIVKRDGMAAGLAPFDLQREGFTVRTLALGINVIQQIERLFPALIIIETTALAGRSLELCREIRLAQSLGPTPLIIVSGNPSAEERALGLESGADDCIAQSTSAREIAARMRAVMRRFSRQDRHSGMPHVSPPFLPSLVGSLGPAIRAGDIEIDTAAMRISIRGTEIETTNLEFRLLYYLVHNQARVFTRDQLLDAVWGTLFVELRSVDACIRRLRRKMEPDPLRPTYLRTVRGVGYCLRSGAA